MTPVGGQGSQVGSRAGRIYYFQGRKESVPQARSRKFGCDLSGSAAVLRKSRKHKKRTLSLSAREMRVTRGLLSDIRCS